MPLISRILFLACLTVLVQSEATDTQVKCGFIKSREHLQRVSGDPSVIIVASPGRSGSTLLYQELRHQAMSNQKNCTIAKTHLLPPGADFKGKILFIYSNPDKAAESALRITLKDKNFGDLHFIHVETADMDWLKAIQNTTLQTLENNLLSFDALGVSEHLSKWLQNRTTPCSQNEAQILAIKYEHLWDLATLDAIKEFIQFDTFFLPEKKERGHDQRQLSEKERMIRTHYNLVSYDNPSYEAYDAARVIWGAAPPFQHLKIN